jgi:hypothetical protein
LNSGPQLRASCLLGRPHEPAIFCFGYFWDRLSCTICPGWPQTMVTASEYLGLQAWATGAGLPMAIFKGLFSWFTVPFSLYSEYIEKLSVPLGSTLIIVTEF